MPIMVSCNASGSSSDGVSGDESDDDHFDYLYELDKQNEDINDEDGGDGGSEEDDFAEMVMDRLNSEEPIFSWWDFLVLK